MSDDLEEVVVSTPRLPTPREQQSGGFSFGSGPSQSPGESRRSGSTRSSPVPSPWGGGTGREFEAVPTPIPPAGPDLPTVVVTAPAPKLPDLDPGGQFHVPTPYGPVVPGAPGSLPFNAPSVSPLRPSPAPYRSPIAPRFMLPEPQTLPEVKIEAKRPRTPARPVLTPAAFGRALLGYAFAFLFVPRAANVGENRRVREQIERDLADRLLPVSVSTTRLTEPLATVTVRGSQLTDRPATRLPASLLGVSLGGIRFQRVRAPFVGSVTSFTRPAPQRARRTGVQASVSPLRGITLADPLPIPGRFTRPIGEIPKTRVPVAPQPRPTIPGLPTVRPGLPPLVGVVPDLGPTLQLQPQPQLRPPGRCVCPQPTREPARKRKPRVECRRGTYIETASGLIKSPKEVVPCQ